MFFYTAPSPLGYLLFTLDTEGLLTTCVFTDILSVWAIDAPEHFKIAFDAYFAEKKPISLKLVARHLTGSEFQRAVWKVIAGVPVGETITYTELAMRVGKPGAARAAGTACGRNPVALAIPCHRVVRTSGEDFGYSWGSDRKKWLLTFENV